MYRGTMLALACALGLGCLMIGSEAQAERGYGREWGHTYRSQDWERFYHYPYVYYPQNFWSSEYQLQKASCP